MQMYAIPEKLRQFRKAKGLSQEDISKLLNIEQTTYSKKELGTSKLSYDIAKKIAEIIEKDVEEFTMIANTVNNITDSTLNNSPITGDVVYNNCTTSIPDKMINTLQELIEIVKKNYK